MKPDNNSTGGNVQGPNSTQDSAANVIRAQIDSMYDHEDTAATAPQSASQEEAPSVFERTHNQHPLPEAEQWKAYHSAWQNYYQQYYSQYYEQQSSSAQQGYFSGQPHGGETYEPESISKDTALNELRSQLRNKVQGSTTKIRKSRHFMPIVAALTVVLVFVFLQYNQVLFGAVHAYVSPGAISPQNIVIDPTNNAAVSDDPVLIIPKINVDVPVLYDVGTDYDSQMAAMEKGVAHFPIPGANAHPGELGNTVLSGHSSNDLFDPGDYKFIFAQLDRLVVGDTIYANYQGIRYTYVVTKSEVVKPTEVSKLVYDTDVPVMTLITCTPLGTSTNRLLVTAEQVSPDPADAAENANSGDAADGEVVIPGNGQTIFEKIFSAIFGN